MNKSEVKTLGDYQTYPILGKYDSYSHLNEILNLVQIYSNKIHFLKSG